MPNYQLPEIPGGVVWVEVPVSEKPTNRGDYLVLPQKIMAYYSNRVDAWFFEPAVEGVMDIKIEPTHWLKPIPVTPVKEVEAEKWLEEYCDNYRPGDFTWNEVVDVLNQYAASLKEKGGEGCQS